MQCKTFYKSNQGHLQKNVFWPFIPSYERAHFTYLTVVVNYQSWPNLDIIYIVLQQ